MLFSAEETGAYIRLLIYQWDKGGIPDDAKKISAIAGVKYSKLKDVLSKFSPAEGGKLANERLEFERESVSGYFARQAQNASKGGRPRKTHGKPTENPRETHGINSGNPNVSHIDIDREEENTVVDTQYPLWFEMFRRVAGPHIDNETLRVEIAKFRNKYPNNHPNRSGGLVNTWVGRIGMIPERTAEQIHDDKMKNVLT